MLHKLLQSAKNRAKKDKQKKSTKKPSLPKQICSSIPQTQTQKMSTIIIPELVPSPTLDCETLNKAFQGWGTDEKAVILCLGQRNASQRKKIKETYEKLYNKSLISDLQSELSGDFLNAIVLWTYDAAERDAILINKALSARTFWKKGGVKHWQVIVEVACAFPPNHLVAVRQAYCSLFDCSIEEDIADNVALPLRKLLLSLVSSYRCDKDMVDLHVAKVEAVHLHDAIKANQLDHNFLVWILSTRNYFQLKATFNFYKQEFSTSIDQDIMDCCGNGDLQSLARAAILCIECPEKHYAEVIQAAVLGLGTDEDSLSRAIVTRAEVDMTKIKFEYAKTYKESLEDAVIGDTSGDYKNFLLTLLGTTI